LILRIVRLLGLVCLIVGTVAAASAQTSRPQSTPAPSFPPDQTLAIEQIIREYLLKNPEVILEAVEGLEKKRQDEVQRAAKTAITDLRDEILNDPNSVAAGNPKGDVTIVEFFDYRCPYCKQMEPSLAQLLKDDPKLRFVYKELPILGPDSIIASRAAIAARRQDKYLELHTALMRARGTLDENTVLKIAADIGLDAKRLKSDMNLPDVEKVIGSNRLLANALSINGSPAFVIGNTLVPGAVDLPTLKSLVADARKK
jgi:protein-disulfide isomerase